MLTLVVGPVAGYDGLLSVFEIAATALVVWFAWT